MSQNIRNIAIIAHVDHGKKRPWCDAMLRQKPCGIFRANEALVERVMDSNDLERERRNAPFSRKNTRAFFHDTRRSTSLTPPATVILAAKLSGRCCMVDGVVVLTSTPAKGRFRRRATYCKRRLPPSCRR